MTLRRRLYKNEKAKELRFPDVSFIAVGKDAYVPNCPFCGLDHVHGWTIKTSKGFPARNQGYRVAHCTGTFSGNLFNEYRLMWSGVKC